VFVHSHSVPYPETCHGCREVRIKRGQHTPPWHVAGSRTYSLRPEEPRHDVSWAAASDDDADAMLHHALRAKACGVVEQQDAWALPRWAARHLPVPRRAVQSGCDNVLRARASR